jgi:hypothetical protein
MAQWGNVYWATDKLESLTAQSGPDSVVRPAFVSNGKLDGSKDTNYRAINNTWPIFAFANDFGNVGTKQASQLFTIGLLQQNAIQFLGGDGLVKLPSLWTSYFGNEIDAVSLSSCIQNSMLIRLRCHSSTRTGTISNLWVLISTKKCRRHQLRLLDKTTPPSLRYPFGKFSVR